MPKRPIKREDLLRIQVVGDPQISPDGTRILFTKKHIGEKNKYITNLYTVDVDGGKVQQWTQAEGGAGNGRWSPDGNTIAFISGRDKPASQIFLISIGGGEARKLTKLPEGSVADLRWSPDGKWIAFQFREQRPNLTEKAKAEREEKGLSKPPREIDSFPYRYDGDGYFLGQRYEIYLVEVATGEHRMLYNASPNGDYSFDWSPNSQELAVIHTANKRPSFELSNDQIWRVDLQGQAVKVEGLPRLSRFMVRWSHNGKCLAYVGMPSENNGWGSKNSRLYMVSADGGEEVCLTPNDDFDITSGVNGDSQDPVAPLLEWSPDDKAIYVSIAHRGELQLGYADVAKGGLHFLTKGHHTVGAASLSRNGERFGCLHGTATVLNEVGVYDLTKHGEDVQVLTHFNQEFLNEVKVVEPQEIDLESPDGVKVHVWFILPPDYLAPKRYPAVIQIHGGPHTQYGWQFFHEFQALAAQGYVVVYSNPRGSKGYGEEFAAAIDGSWGDRDWEDIQTVMRWMQHQPFIHPGLMGVAGGSYGGYMTNWTISHTNDFKAAISDRCVSNIVSFSGNADFAQSDPNYWKGEFYGDIENMWQCSPIAHFKNVKTPTLVIHSEGDYRCNIEQSEQIFTALQQQGIESRFVRYPENSSHGLSRSGPPDLRLHRLTEIQKWWEKHLK